MKKYFSLLRSFRPIFTLPVLLLPSFLFASSPTIQSLLSSFGGLLNQLIPFLVGLGLVFFLFGIVKYMTAGGGEDKAAARNLMIYGVVALFVMVSVWGLVRFLQVALGINGTNQTQISSPSIPNDFYSGNGQPPIGNNNGTPFGGTSNNNYIGSPFQGGSGFTGSGGNTSGGASYKPVGTGVDPKPLNQY